MGRKKHGASPERAKTDESLREERDNTDDAIRGDRKSAERVAEKVIDKARAVADAIVSAERKKTDEAKHPARRPARKRLGGQRAAADREIRGQRATADNALRSDLKDRAHALEALLVHERAATDAYLLTERVRSDDDVAHRDDFLGMVAHDVRNLLNGVMLNVELVAPAASGPGAANPQVAAAAARIRRDVGRMNRLIGDLVDVTSIDAGKLAMVPIEADAAALLSEATETFQAAAAAKGVALSAKVPATPLPALFDPDRLLQVFANLLSNAIKFTPRDGRIEVTVEKVRGGLRFCVCDSGVGVAGPMLKPIFERFWQVGKNDHRGMGLGLYISKCIVDAHHGRIWAKSKPGKGSEFYFTLPVRAARARRTSTR